MAPPRGAECSWCGWCHGHVQERHQFREWELPEDAGMSGKTPLRDVGTKRSCGGHLPARYEKAEGRGRRWACCTVGRGMSMT